VSGVETVVRDDSGRVSEAIRVGVQDKTVSDSPEQPAKNGQSGAVALSGPAVETKSLLTIPSPASIPAGLSRNDEILTVVVEKEVTLRQLSLQYVGRFDEVVLGEIYTLNPDVHDASHIEIGQRLRLPLYLRQEFKNRRLPLVRSASLEAQKDAQ
jgi:hypothetical protein